MRKKHSFEVRLLVVHRYLNGDSAKQIEKDLGVGENYSPIYVAKYKVFGEEGLRK
jgi:transposase